MSSATMQWCRHCKDVCPVGYDPAGMTCCFACGRVVNEDVFTNAPAFEKTSNGQIRFSGTTQRLGTEYSLSRERTLNKGKDEIAYLVNGLSMSGGESIIFPAYNLYKIAVERNFTRGRSTTQIAAACLYIACRQDVRPYLLIDFSNHLQINVYVLGAVFLQLCRLLSLDEHPIIQKPIDPSLFLGRFTQCLLGSDNKEVTRTALNIIASMKRDWMQTGRKPSGLCGAALYIAAHSHQLRCSKSDIAKAVFVCEATLTKRLIEFENTESASLTTEELDEKAKELRQESHQSIAPGNRCKKSGITEMLCQHKDGDQPHFAHGLCKECYDEFVEISGGLEGGSEPPAFQRAEMQRKAEAEKKARESSQDVFSCGPEDECDYDGNGANFSSSPSTAENVLVGSKEPEYVESDTNGNADKSASYKSFQHEDASNCAVDEPESLSDIDDLEVDGYLHTEEEKHFKKIIWEEMNKEYLEELAAKEAAEAAAREAYIAQFANSSEDLRSAQELAAAAAAAVAKSKKERKQKRAEAVRNSGPAKTAAEATSQMLKRKTFSSKINYEVLNTLYTTDQEHGKKQRAESQIDDKYAEPHGGNKIEDEAFDSKVDDYNHGEDDAAGATFYEDNYTGGDDDDYANDDEFGIF